MRKKLGGLALEDLRIKSKFLRFNMPIREVGRSGERKNPRGRRKKRKKARVGRLGAWLKYKLGTVDLDAKLSAKIHGAELGAKIHDAELAAMSASTPPTWPGPRRQTLWRQDV